jgi:hypothetical protein
MAIETEPCASCKLYTKGFNDSMERMKKGEVIGLGMLQFYLGKMIDYPVERELEEAIRGSCRTCSNFSVYNKNTLTELKDTIDLVDNFSSFIPEETQSDILKEIAEIYNHVRKFVEEQNAKMKSGVLLV